MSSSEQLIKKLRMTAHPEGGYYRETYRDQRVISLPEEVYEGGERAASTAIHYLLAGSDMSTWHRIKSDEIWHFCAGCPVVINVIDLEGKWLELVVGAPGSHPAARYQQVVPAGVWFSAKPLDADHFSLVTCTVAPGFDFRDFELGEEAGLIQEYPEYAAKIKLFCRSESSAF